MSKPVQNPEAGSALQRLFNLVGRVRPSLEEYIIPTVQIADLSLRSEPPVSRLCSATSNTFSVAPNFPSWRIDAQPGTVVRLNKLIIRGNAAKILYVSFAAVGTVSNAVNTHFTDSRAPGTPNSEVYDDDTGSIAGGAFETHYVGVSEQVIDLSHIVLAPGENAARDWVTFQTSTAGGNDLWTLLWEEFPIL